MNELAVISGKIKRIKREPPYFAAGNVTKRRELAQLALTRLKKLVSFAENL
jgi:hypothetical protein